MAAREVLVVVVCLVIVLLISTAPDYHSQLSSRSVEAQTRCQLTLDGLFNYYWKSDPKHKKIQFLYACGQLGTMGTAVADKCSCSTPNSCVNCYRWWTAVMMESVATYGIHMNTTNHSSLPNMVYSHSPYNAKWDAVKTCTYVDDFLWYGIAYLRVYDWLSVSLGDGQSPFLNLCPCICMYSQDFLHNSV